MLHTSLMPFSKGEKIPTNFLNCLGLLVRPKLIKGQLISKLIQVLFHMMKLFHHSQFPCGSICKIFNISHLQNVWPKGGLNGDSRVGNRNAAFSVWHRPDPHFGTGVLHTENVEDYHTPHFFTDSFQQTSCNFSTLVLVRSHRDLVITWGLGGF